MIVKDEHLLAEVEDLKATMPPLDGLHLDTDTNVEWLARLAAFVRLWDVLHSSDLRWSVNNLRGVSTSRSAKRTIHFILCQAQNELRLKTLGPVNMAVGEGSVYKYFEGIGKIIEAARTDLFFIDPYLDADFVSRYLILVATGVSIRLLTGDKKATLLPSVEAFTQEHGAKVQIRSATSLHDRYIIVDGSNCYQSGASFKDGARTASTTLTQITDAFTAVQKTYEDLWANGKVIR